MPILRSFSPKRSKKREEEVWRSAGDHQWQLKSAFFAVRMDFSHLREFYFGVKKDFSHLREFYFGVKKDFSHIREHHFTVKKDFSHLNIGILPGKNTSSDLREVLVAVKKGISDM